MQIPLWNKQLEILIEEFSNHNIRLHLKDNKHVSNIIFQTRLQISQILTKSVITSVAGMFSPTIEVNSTFSFECSTNNGSRAKELNTCRWQHITNTYEWNVEGLNFCSQSLCCWLTKPWYEDKKNKTMRSFPTQTESWLEFQVENMLRATSDHAKIWFWVLSAGFRCKINLRFKNYSTSKTACYESPCGCAKSVA